MSQERGFTAKLSDGYLTDLRMCLTKYPTKGCSWLILVLLLLPASVTRSNQLHICQELSSQDFKHIHICPTGSWYMIVQTETLALWKVKSRESGTRSIISKTKNRNS